MVSRCRAETEEESLLNDEGWTEISGMLPFSLDWDGDGEEETIDVQPVHTGNNMDGISFSLTLINNGKTWESGDPGVWSFSLFLTDLGGDGNYELFLSGDTASSDYVTYCWRLAAGDPQPLIFTGETRYEDNDLDGSAIGCFSGLDEEGRVLIASNVYMLGTYSARRPYVLSGEREFSPAPDTIWDYVGNNREITARIDLTAKACLDNARNGTPTEEALSIPAGSKLVLTGSDGVSCVYFETAEGLHGCFSVEKQDFLWYVQGLDENEVFSDLPYAG